ncbi:hypothetical protein E2C01_060450 [Portunus trituberculatus]|uniref:Uncharacterized protein n=1 Tax=Portunus trituberculatus TaxID=210409 RepID=A0A5B7H834_PORTR|nr:hypothetical protein [Portunus trituberculatus]
MRGRPSIPRLDVLAGPSPSSPQWSQAKRLGVSVRPEGVSYSGNIRQEWRGSSVPYLSSRARPRHARQIEESCPPVLARERYELTLSQIYIHSLTYLHRTMLTRNTTRKHTPGPDPLPATASVTGQWLGRSHGVVLGSPGTLARNTPARCMHH